MMKAYIAYLETDNQKLLAPIVESITKYIVGAIAGATPFAILWFKDKN